MMDARIVQTSKVQTTTAESHQQTPIVAVTGPDKKLKLGWWATRLVLKLVGLKACYVTPKYPAIPEGVRGVIIGGGDDIDPQHYGITGDAGAEYDAARDALEMSVVRCAIKEQVPLLGICRGAQLINVVMGGNLFGDIRPLRKITLNRNSAFPVKWADLVDNSLLQQRLGKSSVKINSLHNQAVQNLADPLSVTARDKDRFIQAFEGHQKQFIVGVQWHPEYLFYSSIHRRLFHWFAEAVFKSDQILSRNTIENPLLLQTNPEQSP